MVVPISNFQADRSFDDSVVLRWTEDVDGTIIKIVRKERDYPYTIGDGLAVYTGSAGWETHEDFLVQDVTWYYYQIWYWDVAQSNWLTDVSLRVISIAVKKAGMSQVIKNNSPEIYNRAERATSPDDPFFWQTLRDEILALLLEDVAGMTRAFPKLVDVDECPGPSLAGLARLVGIDPNFELSYTRQREEIRAAVDIWRTKGTPASLIRAVRSISGLDAEIDIWVDNIILKDSLTRTKIDFSDATEISRYPGLGHTTCHKIDFDLEDPDSRYNTFSFAVYVSFSGSGPFQGLTQEIVRKLRRVLEINIPVFKKLHLFFQGGTDNTETYPYTTVDSLHQKKIKDQFTEKVDVRESLICAKLSSTIASKKYRSALPTTQQIILETHDIIVNNI